MNPNYGIIGFLLLFIVIGVILFARFKTREEQTFLAEDPSKPYLWLFYDTNQVNSRLWADFGARSSRALNMPYLNLCYESILKNADAYNVKVLKGLESVAELLGGWEQIPEEIRTPIAVLNPKQKEWIRTEVLKSKGGLWLEPSVIVLKPIPVPEVNTFWGITDDIMVATPAALRENKLFALFVNKDNLDAKSVQDGRILQRKPNGKRIEVEDLLASLRDGTPQPFDVPADTIFIPIPGDELQRLRKVGWFLRMSEKQIMESPLMISMIFHHALEY
jgi:hypothetical protein